MTLVFENELYDMTETAKEQLLSDDLPWQYQGDVIFEEHPYGGYRTDLVTVGFGQWDLARRKRTLGHLTPLPDERKYRRSYRKLLNRAPMTRERWVKEDSTYASEQTSREVWDWLVEYNYLPPCSDAELGERGVQTTLTDDKEPTSDDRPHVPVRYPINITAVAWELKQRDWETALRQAMRADSYANYRMVLMDAGGVDVDHDLTSEFSKAGVGLATLDSGGVEIYEYPDRAQPANTQSRFMLNERAVAELPGSVAAEVEEKVAELDE